MPRLSKPFALSKEMRVPTSCLDMSVAVASLHGCKLHSDTHTMAYHSYHIPPPIRLDVLILPTPQPTSCTAARADHASRLHRWPLVTGSCLHICIPRILGAQHHLVSTVASLALPCELSLSKKDSSYSPEHRSGLWHGNLMNTHQFLSFSTIHAPEPTQPPYISKENTAIFGYLTILVLQR